MQTQGLTSHLDRGNGSVPATFGDPARRLAVSALVVGVAFGACASSRGGSDSRSGGCHA